LANCEADQHVIEVLGSVLAGSDRLLIVTSGTANSAPGRLVTEDDPPASSKVAPRAASEEATASVAAQGVRVAIVQLPQVHDTVKQGLVTYAVNLAHEKSVSAFVGDGSNRWPAVQRLDAAHLYRLVLFGRVAESASIWQMSERITITPAWACPARKKFCRNGLSIYPLLLFIKDVSRKYPPY
jgi:hypothetical protein